MTNISRRKFVAGAVLASGGVALGCAVASLPAFDQLLMPATRGAKDGLIAWVKLGADNLVTVIATHSETGAAGVIATRHAGAVSRWTLIQTVARQWQVPPQSITIGHGHFLHAASSRSTGCVPVMGDAALPWVKLILRNAPPAGSPTLAV